MTRTYHVHCDQEPCRWSAHESQPDITHEGDGRALAHRHLYTKAEIHLTEHHPDTEMKWWRFQWFNYERA